jgi:hypothetical protein
MKTSLRQTYEHAVFAIQMRQKYNTTAAYEKRIIFGGELVNQKIFKSYNTNT